MKAGVQLEASRPTAHEDDREPGDGVYTTRVPADFQRTLGTEGVTAKLDGLSATKKGA